MLPISAKMCVENDFGITLPTWFMVMYFLIVWLERAYANLYYAFNLLGILYQSIFQLLDKIQQPFFDLAEKQIYNRVLVIHRNW